MTELTIADTTEQPALPGEPFDRWVSPDGTCMAEFHRDDPGFIVRFPGEADFWIDPTSKAVIARPAVGKAADHARKLFANSVVPLLGNYNGGLFLHGSAVAVRDRAIAFLGTSRSGKTTLAGAFAKDGHPFLTEDVIDLTQTGHKYVVQPISTSLRLFDDSAAYLLGERASGAEEKLSYEGGSILPFSDQSRSLAAIYILGSDHAAPFSIDQFTAGAALTAMMQHAFILDVEDRARVAGHFGRLADLAERVPVYSLEYPREYSALPKVLDAILNVSSEAREA